MRRVHRIGEGGRAAAGVAACVALLGAAACAAPAAPVSVPVVPPPPATAPVATTPVTTAAAPEAAPPVPVSPPPPEPEREGPSAGLHLHGRDTSGLQPGDLVHGSGALPAPVPGPSVEMGAPSGVADVSDAVRVVAALRPGFRRCYARALDADAAMIGGFTVEAKLGPKGDVVGVIVKGTKGIPSELATCLTAVFQRARFAAPQGSAATLMVPFNLTR
jgi:hypothetical protein